MKNHAHIHRYLTIHLKGGAYLFVCSCGHQMDNKGNSWWSSYISEGIKEVLDEYNSQKGKSNDVR